MNISMSTFKETAIKLDKITLLINQIAFKLSNRSFKNAFLCYTYNLWSSKESAKLTSHEDENILCAYELEKCQRMTFSLVSIDFYIYVDFTVSSLI